VLVVLPGGHCGGGAIAWPNATWGDALAEDFSLVLYNDTIGPPVSTAGWAPATLAAARSARQLVSRLTGTSTLDTAVVFYVHGPGLPLSVGKLLQNRKE
jgi:hypothetical protein